jgi:molybdate transport system substrate-binding protein
MKIRASILLAFGLLAVSPPAGAAELKIFTSRAIATVLWELGGQFEASTGNKLNVISGFSPEFIKRINGGESFDLLFSPPPIVDKLINEGKLAADSRVMLVRSDVGIEVRAGAAKPNIATVDALKQTLLNAKSITYLPVPGVPQMIERLGLADALKTKSVIPDTDIVSELVAEGKVELGIVVITQILTTPGVELVGPLPPELKITTSFAGAIGAQSGAPQAARDLIAFLTRPETAKVMRAQGMEPLFAAP